MPSDDYCSHGVFWGDPDTCFSCRKQKIQKLKKRPVKRTQKGITKKLTPTKNLKKFKKKFIKLICVLDKHYTLSNNELDIADDLIELLEKIYQNETI